MTASTDRNAGIAWPDRYRWLGLFFVTCILSVAGLGQTAEADHYVWFGCYTGKPPRGEGIYVSRYSDQTGELGPTELACTVKNPSFLTLHPTLPVLYALEDEAAAGGDELATLLAGELGDADIARALELLRASDGLARARAEAAERVDAACAHLSVFGERKAVTALERLG